MTVVIDANVLLRFADPTAAQHPVAVAALSALRTEGHALHTIPHSLYEFWVVATRPVANNGLELSIAECEQTVAGIEALFPLLPDHPALFTEWRTLVVAYACHGKVAHDARYVAAMRALGITHLLTLNGTDFARFPGLTVLDPITIAAPPSGSAPPPPSSMTP
jgi:predicted nucleic acid-binding protein